VQVAGQGPVAERERIDAALVFDVNAEVPIGSLLSVYATCQNVGNTVTFEAMRPSGARPGAPRILMFGVRARLAPKRQAGP
jgi:Fe(3+) dicitrate transport protein